MEGARYDLVIDTDKERLRAQIKYCSRLNKNRKNHLSIPLSKNSKGNICRGYSKNEIDILLVFVPQINNILCFSAKKFHKKSVLTINLKHKNSKNYYENFIW